MGERMLALLEQAMDLYTTHPRPRPRPSLGLGRVCAAQAVETTRLSQLAAELWAGRYQTSNDTGTNHDIGINWRVRTFLALNQMYEPFYRWGMNRGWMWLSPLGAKAKKILLRPE
jgi:hypothetical protein